MKKLLLALLLCPSLVFAQTAKIPLITSAQDPSQLIGTINALANAVNMINTTGTASLTGANTSTGVNNFTNATGVTVTTPGNIGFELLGGPNGATTLPVPTFYPVANNQAVALDLSPHGIATDDGYGHSMVGHL